MNIGIIGLKGHESVVLKGAKQLGNCRVTAVSDSNAGELAKFVKNEPLASGAQTYADWRMLLEHSMLDVCVLCDENWLHADQLVAAAERGMHIVSEKPLATTLPDLERVRSALGKSKGRTTMLLTMRHEPRYPAMRKLVQQGAIGPVCQIASQKSYRRGERPEWQKSRQTMGGTIPFIGIHSIDLMRWVAGVEFTHVAAFHGNNGSPDFKESEDQASILLRCASGASATSRLDYLRPGTAPTHGDDRLRIAGAEGVIEVAGEDEGLLLMTRSEPPRRIKPEPVQNLFVEFVKAIEGGRPTPIPVEDCLRLTEIVLKARDAADNKQMVTL